MATNAADVPQVTRKTANFGAWKYDDAKKALDSLKLNDFPEQFQIASDYATKHDFYRGGDEWVGPGTPDSSNDIESQFAPDDVVGEALNNVANAFNEPQVGFAPLVEPSEGETLPPSIRQKIAEAQSWFSEWWDRVRLQEAIHDRLYTSAWSGRSALRLWVPERFLLRSGQSVRVFSAPSVRDALGYIYLSSPSPEVCGIYTDPATQERCLIFLGERDSLIDGEGSLEKWAELTYLDPQANPGEPATTIIRVVYETESRDTPSYTARLNVEGTLLAAEMEARTLITEPVVRAQRQLNLIWSLVSHIAITAGFRERTIINAKPQGVRRKYQKDSPIPEGAFVERDAQNVEWLVIPMPRTLGADTTTELVGLPRYNDNGKVAGHETPNILVHDPVDPTPYVEAAGSVRGRIMRMVNQGHLTNTSAAEASGFAYEQARAAFEKDLLRRRVSEEGMLRLTIHGLFLLAESISGQKGYFTEHLRVTVDQHIDPGPRAPEAVRTDIEAHEKGLLSDETTMARLRVEDTEAEMSRLRLSPKYILDLLAKASEGSATFSTDAILRALEEAGVPKALITALSAQDTDDLVQPPVVEEDDGDDPEA